MTLHDMTDEYEISMCNMTVGINTIFFLETMTIRHHAARRHATATPQSNPSHAQSHISDGSHFVEMWRQLGEPGRVDHSEILHERLACVHHLREQNPDGDTETERET